MGKELTIVIKTFKGLEEVLEEEIKSELGIQEVTMVTRGASFKGDLQKVYEANLKLRSASRVLVEIHSFQAHTYDEYYKEVLAFPWSDYLEVSDTFNVDGVAHSEKFNNAKFLEHRTKDAIVDYFEKATNRRPSIEKKHPRFKINAQVDDTTCIILLDSTGGDPLYKRGYRQAPGDAPLNEVLASGLIALSGWDFEQPLLDPMCGSGTLLIEAALKAKNVYPGEFREFYAFKYWKDFSLSLFGKVKDDLKSHRKDVSTVKLLGQDIDRSVLRIAAQNAESAGVSELIKFTRKDFFRTSAPVDNSLVIANPPYADRSEEGVVDDLYERIGEKLKADYASSKVWLVLFDREEKKSLNAKPTREISLDNGGVHCDFACYESVTSGRKFKFGK